MTKRWRYPENRKSISKSFNRVLHMKPAKSLRPCLLLMDEAERRALIRMPYLRFLDAALPRPEENGDGRSQPK